MSVKYRYYYFDKLDSTNNTAFDFPAYSVIICKEQTHGRGRMGHKWISGFGNLTASIVLPTMNKNELSSFIVSLALCYAIGRRKCHIKWPNDILIKGKKVAGILIERNKDCLIIGVGVNIKSHPSSVLSTALFQENPEKLLKRILKYLDKFMLIYQKKGFEKIRKKWLKRCLFLKQEIKVNLPKKNIKGIFDDVNTEGYLVLRTAEKIHLFPAGEIE